jgi:transcriptional regulator with XRE-family HTH domain
VAEIIPARFREAREYIGFTLDQAATALHCSRLLLESLEDGGVEPAEGFTVQLCRLYRRPLKWFTGESEFQPSRRVLAQVEKLTEGDRAAVLDFAEFLQGAGPAPASARELTRKLRTGDE